MDQKKSSIRFLLSGSSARKLKRGQSNLLPGRIISLQLGPLSSRELNYALDTNQALSTGTLPGIYTDPNPADRMLVLDSYASTYVKEEVQAEALTRNIEGFSRFLFVAASRSTKFLDFTKIANIDGLSGLRLSHWNEVGVKRRLYARNPYTPGFWGDTTRPLKGCAAGDFGFSEIQCSTLRI